MPKYRIEVSCTADFEIDTDDYAEEFNEQELDPNDPDVIHDFVRELIEDDLGNFDNNPSIDEIKVHEPVKKK